MQVIAGVQTRPAEARLRGLVAVVSGGRGAHGGFARAAAARCAAADCRVVLVPEGGRPPAEAEWVVLAGPVGNPRVEALRRRVGAMGLPLVLDVRGDRVFAGFAQEVVGARTAEALAFLPEIRGVLVRHTASGALQIVPASTLGGDE